jgi:hypothetical protein
VGSSAKPALWTSIDRYVDFDRPWHETSIDVIVYSLAYCDAVFFSINKAILLASIFIDIQLQGHFAGTDIH